MVQHARERQARQPEAVLVLLLLLLADEGGADLRSVQPRRELQPGAGQRRQQRQQLLHARVVGDGGALREGVGDVQPELRRRFHPLRRHGQPVVGRLRAAIHAARQQRRVEEEVELELLLGHRLALHEARRRLADDEPGGALHVDEPRH